MRLDLDNLPSDVGLLHQLVRDMASLVDTSNDEIERLQAIIKKLQRMQFGRRSERLDPDQLALGLEDLDADIGCIEEGRPLVATPASEPRPKRVGARKAARGAHHPSQIRLPGMRNAGPGTGARARDRGRTYDTCTALAGTGEQILRPHAALPSVAHLRPAWG